MELLLLLLPALATGVAILIVGILLTKRPNQSLQSVVIESLAGTGIILFMYCVVILAVSYIDIPHIV